MRNLDKQLQKWAASHEVSSEHEANLQAAIRRRLHTERRSELRRRLPTALRYGLTALAGAAASLLVVWLLKPGTPMEPKLAHQEVDPVMESITAQQLEGDRLLFTEMNRLFDGQLRWVVRSGGKVDITLADDREPGVGTDQPTLVRVTVVKRTGRGNWETCWGVDVLARGEEFVDIATADAGGRLKIWAYPLGDGKVAVDTDMVVDVPVRMTTLGNQVVDDGMPVQIGSGMEAGVEYRVYQTVKALKAG